MATPNPIDLAAAPTLSRRYGKEVVNFFSESPLNRLSFLRTSTPFLRAALPHARFILFNNLSLLTTASRTHCAFLPYEQVKHLLPPGVFEVTDEEVVEGFDSSREGEEGGNVVVFLGVDEEGRLESGGEGEEKEKEKELFKWKEYTGTPYFAIDVGRAVGERRIGTGMLTEGGREWSKARIETEIAPIEAGILAHARSILDWNARNKFCAACGSRTISTQSGTKRICPPTDKAVTGARPPCLARKGVHNIAFPRTDPTVIMAIINHKGDKMLLGRQKSWPPNFYSTLAGFCEPGESLTSSVRREAWEESGLRISHVQIHSSQPWPYPSNLMIGCIAETFPGEGEVVHLGHDQELDDARWFSKEEVMVAVKGRGETTGMEYKAVGEVEGEEGKEGLRLRLPPKTAIAHQLILGALEVMESWEVGREGNVGKAGLVESKI
ncbi:NUDIX hydrolase domain-like protein [Peziza echinospora]|nr:NUDIX hydrolase domain-like protein [Peziza echinospora]